MKKNGGKQTKSKKNHKTRRCTALHCTVMIRSYTALHYTALLPPRYGARGAARHSTSTDSLFYCKPRNARCAGAAAAAAARHSTSHTQTRNTQHIVHSCTLPSGLYSPIALLRPVLIACTYPLQVLHKAVAYADVLSVHSSECVVRCGM